MFFLKYIRTPLIPDHAADRKFCPGIDHAVVKTGRECCLLFVGNELRDPFSRQFHIRAGKFIVHLPLVSEQKQSFSHGEMCIRDHFVHLGGGFPSVKINAADSERVFPFLIELIRRDFKTDLLFIFRIVCFPAGDLLSVQPDLGFIAAFLHIENDLFSLHDIAHFEFCPIPSHEIFRGVVSDCGRPGGIIETGGFPAMCFFPCFGSGFFEKFLPFPHRIGIAFLFFCFITLPSFLASVEEFFHPFEILPDAGGPESFQREPGLDHGPAP